MNHFRTVLLCIMLLAVSVVVIADDDTEISKALRERWITEMMNGANPDLAEEIVSEDFIGHVPWDQADWKGVDSVKGLVTNNHASFVDFSVQDLAMVAEGNFVASVIFPGGTFAESFPYPHPLPTGGQNVIMVHRIEDDKIAEWWVMQDSVLLGRQWGLLPSPTELEPIELWNIDVNLDSGDPDQNKALVKNYLQSAFSDKDFDAVSDLVSDDFTMHLPPSLFPAPTDLASARGWLNAFTSAFPDLELMSAGNGMEEGLLAEGNMVVYFDYNLMGTFEGEFLGMPPNNAEMEWAGLSVYRIEDNKIAEIWFMFDTFGMISQLTDESG